MTRPLAVLFASLAACGGLLAEGESDFRKGRYVEAKEVLASIESEARRYGESQRAEYALYRGLTLAALGDRDHAAVWLLEAKALADARAEVLSPVDLRRLTVALEALATPP